MGEIIARGRWQRAPDRFTPGLRTPRSLGVFGVLRGSSLSSLLRFLRSLCGKTFALRALRALRGCFLLCFASFAQRSRPSRSPSSPPRPTLRRIWRALRTPTPNERPPGVPALRYRFPLSWAFSMGRDMLLGRPRSFRADCALAVRALPLRPKVEGLEHVPREGPLIVVANHYQRRDLWVGFCGGLLCDALWSVRDDLRCRFVVTDRALLDGATVPLTRAVFARVARVWDMILVTPAEALDANAKGARRHALRICLRALRGESGRSTCLIISPEGVRGNTRGLKAAAAGSGRSLLALDATGAPLLPAAVYEEPGGALHLSLGPAWHPTPPRDLPKAQLDAWAGDDALRRVAALLPEHLLGAYARDTGA